MFIDSSLQGLGLTKMGREHEADPGSSIAFRLIGVSSDVREHADGGRPVRGIGEPVWPGRSDSELDECQRHEALLNVAFAYGPAWSLLCPYDLDELDPRQIQAARVSHPTLRHEGISRRSDAYLPLHRAPSSFTGKRQS